MIIVSDSSPLQYLVLVGAVNTLPELFEKVLVPPAVAAELQHDNIPDAVRSWLRYPPWWAEVRGAAIVPVIYGLGPGETEAIAIAGELGVRTLLMDDRLARREAAARGFRVVGTLAVIDEAGQRGLLDLAETLARLAATNFRTSPRLVQQLLKRDAERRGRSAEGP